jgi:colicin import membrane protein/protein TonB
LTREHASALSRRERIWPAVLASAVFHVAAFGWALNHRGTIDPGASQKPLVAKLVRLGEKKPDELLPRKEAEPLPPPPAASAAPVAPPAAAKPAPTAKQVPSKLVATAPKEKAPPDKAGPTQPGGDPLARVMSKLQKEKADEGPRWGDPKGEADGDAAEAGEGDRYLALATRALKANYRVPATIPPRERLHLRATVIILVEPNGVIREARVTRASGNDAFDASVERSARATRLPPPPAEFKDRYRRDGIEVEYTP